MPQLGAPLAQSPMFGPPYPSRVRKETTIVASFSEMGAFTFRESKVPGDAPKGFSRMLLFELRCGL